MHVQRNVNKVLSDRFADDVALLIGRVLQEFLAQVVAKGIYKGWVRKVLRKGDKSPLTSHQVRKVAERLTEYHVTMFRKAFLQLLLQIATSMLVFAKGGNLSLQVFQTRTSEAID